jgi:hypothetical protein
MNCRRCGGFIVGVSFSDGETATGAWAYTGCKCLNCGCITDPLILNNRIAQFQRAGLPKSIVERANGIAPSLNSRRRRPGNHGLRGPCIRPIQGGALK